MQKIASSARFYPVKMSMEVSFTIHSHIIGRGGQNINAVMKETKTKIHFPDGNRIAGEKKSNTVTLAGELQNVEMARQRIRMSIPIEYVVECMADKLDGYGRSELVKEFAFLHGVLIRLSERNFGALCQVTLRGCHQEINRLQEAVAHLTRIVEHGPNMPKITMKMEMTGDNLKAIQDNLMMMQEKYDVNFLVPLPTDKQEELVIWIRGTVDGVYKARMALTGLLPMNLMFHANAVHLTYGVNERKLAKRLDVAVRMEASSKVNSFLVTITSFEKNSANIYEFRRQILRLSTGTHLNDYVKFTSVAALKGSAPSLNVQRVDNAASQPSFRGTNQPKPILKAKKLLIPPSSNHPPFSHENPIPASLHALKFDANSFRQLCQLLKEIGLSEYSDVMLMNEVDLAMFSTLNEDDLKMIGVASFHSRKLMLQAIYKLKYEPVSVGKKHHLGLFQSF